MDQIRIKLALPARVPPWLAALFFASLVASGTVPIIRAFSPSYAGIPVERAPSLPGTHAHGSGNVDPSAGQPEVAAAGAVVARRSGVWCADCGVVASMRQLVRTGDAATTPAGTASGDTAGPATPADGATMVDYEFTVRFRDGSAIVFNEATPRTWRPGSRVIVIGRSLASTDLR